MDNVRVMPGESAVQAHPIDGPARRERDALNAMGRILYFSEVSHAMLRADAGEDLRIPSGVHFKSRSRLCVRPAPNRPASATPDPRATAIVAARCACRIRRRPDEAAST